METRSCKWCGSSFEVARTTSQQQFCSHNCKSSHGAKTARDKKFATRPTQCAECGGPIAQPATGAPRKFCSDTCKQRTGNRRVNRSLMPLAQPVERKCAHCGDTFVAKNRNRVYCYGKFCAQAAYAAGRTSKMSLHKVTCDDCGTIFTAQHPSARWCSKLCANRHWGRVRARQRRQRTEANYADLEVFQRDGWRCHICGELTDWTVPRTHPRGATIDHIVPLTKGGLDELGNVATAHHQCNIAKGNR